MPNNSQWQRPSAPVRVIAWIGARVIYALIWLFGKLHPRDAVRWLDGPVGRAEIGDAPYRETAETEGLSLERHAVSGGLLESFGELASPEFDPSKVHPKIRHFYEHTAAHRMDVWPRTYFPANLALRLLVKTISRDVNQLNFPTDVLHVAEGMDSEIIHLRTPDGALRYAGWFRSLRRTGRVLYTGFYMNESVPGEPGPCVKVIFPMPGGNATVILRPTHGPEGSFMLSSSGKGFGAAGFYRVQRAGGDGDHNARKLRVWRISSLKEDFRLYVDEGDRDANGEGGVLHCDHKIRFLGMPVLTLHFRISEKPTPA